MRRGGKLSPVAHAQCLPQRLVAFLRRYDVPSPPGDFSDEGGTDDLGCGNVVAPVLHRSDGHFRAGRGRKGRLLPQRALLPPAPGQDQERKDPQKGSYGPPIPDPHGSMTIGAGRYAQDWAGIYRILDLRLARTVWIEHLGLVFLIRLEYRRDHFHANIAARALFLVDIRCLGHPYPSRKMDFQYHPIIRKSSCCYRKRNAKRKNIRHASEWVEAPASITGRRMCPFPGSR
jgi:hypothetical protein